MGEKSEHEPPEGGAEAERQIATLRGRIDALDEEILALVARRLDVVDDIALVKREAGLPIRDAQRERTLLESREGSARKLQLPDDLVESLFRLLMWASRDRQAQQSARLSAETSPRTVAIIGAHGGMGRRLKQMFEDLGHRVLAVDVDTALRPEEAARQAEVTLVSVPIALTEEVIRAVGPQVPEHGLLMDVTSIKTGPMKAMLSHCAASVVGTHPMFGPGVHSLQGHRVVLCPGRGSSWLDWTRALFESRGLVIAESSPEEHDRAMGSVQVLTHFQTQVLGWTLARMGSPLTESLRFKSPAYLMELYVAARHFGQDPDLYGPIEMTNPAVSDIASTFASTAAELGGILDRGDQEAFRAMFAEVRGFFGAFSTEAIEESRFMMDRLVERS